jgi:hypothetical protein
MSLIEESPVAKETVARFPSECPTACRIPIWPFVVTVKSGQRARLKDNAGEEMPQFPAAIQLPDNYDHGDSR